MKEKMKWLVDAYKKGTLEYRIKDTKESKGTVVMPTGTGKSGEVYADIIWHIDHIKHGEKIIFNLSAPILKLEAQFANDLFEVLNSIPHFKDMLDNGDIEFYVNSSDDGDAYDCGDVLDVNRFSTDIHNFNANSAKIAIVASCHKSLPKFAERMDELMSFATVIEYIDEGHMVINEIGKDSKYEKLSVGDKEKFDSFSKICEADEVYILTATPDVYVSKIVNDAAGRETVSNTTGYIINILARDAIKNNIILPVVSHYARVSDSKNEYKITPKMCADFMDLVKKDNDKINHKILVTCSETGHLVELSNALKKMGYNVFSTCYNHGGVSVICGDEENVDPVEFVKTVDDFSGDCFVLHIQQLTQGIDIKTLTDAIYYNSCALDNKQKRRLIQTIGRILRTANGERGYDEAHRTKKHGNVLLLIKDDAYDVIRKEMQNFLLLYYGRDGVKAFTYDISTSHHHKGAGTGVFELGNGIDGDYFDFFEDHISQLKINMDKYIREQVEPKYRLHLRLMGKKSGSFIPKMYSDMKKRFHECDGSEWGLGSILSNAEFNEAVQELFNHYGID